MPPPELLGSTLGPQPLPRLVRIDGSSSSVRSRIQPNPTKRIHSDADLEAWKASKACEDVILFVARLCEAAVGKETAWPQGEGITAPGMEGAGPSTSQLDPHRETYSHHPAVDAVMRLLMELKKWTREITPMKSPQRFGNLAFREWGARLLERSSQIHKDLLQGQPDLTPFISELQAYLYDSFGSFVRIDYGSGHEVNFLAWLAYLMRLGLFQVPQLSDSASTEIGVEASPPSQVEEELALKVIPAYLEVVWELQDRYALEPAGSHGVWGLDDYQFLPYIIGSAQLRDQTLYPPSVFSQVSHRPPSKLPPSDLLSFIPTRDSPPFANLFTTSIARIHSLKTGPFFEHSPLLNDISTTVPNWKKLNGGMIKMWKNEVLGKRPVVQHFVFGGVGYVWQGSQQSRKEESAFTQAQSPSQSHSQTATSNGQETNASTRERETSRTALPPTASMLPPTRLPNMMAPPTAAPWARQAASLGAPTAAPSTSRGNGYTVSSMAESSLGPRPGRK